MLVEQLTEKALATIGDRLVDVLSAGIRNHLPRHVKISKPTREHVRNHLHMVQKWATEISFRDLSKPKRLTESFVDLDLLVGQYGSESKDSPKRLIHVSDLLHQSGNIVLLGDPGAGKTTSLKRLALGLLHIATTSDRYPVLINLREFAKRDSLASTIITQVGSHISFGAEIDEDRRRALMNRAAQNLLDDHSIVLLVDGLDEVDPAARDILISDLRGFLLHSHKAKIILTCRTADYIYSLDSTNVMRLRPLSKEQIAEFALKWLGPSTSDQFLTQLGRTPYHGAEVRPLNLAHLCAIFERSGTIPEKLKTVYRKIVRIMLEEWDEQRSVERYSRYANFAIDRKEEFLEALAYRLTLNFHSPSFTHSDLHDAYLHIYESFGLPRNEASRVVREIESHTGLILESAYEQFEFSHKSIQEYLTAAFALKLPDLPLGMFTLFPHETALLLALSPDPNRHFSLIVNTLIGRSPKQMVHREHVEPLVGRIAVERVDFRRSDALGYEVLKLAAATYKVTPSPHDDLTARRNAGNVTYPVAFLEFLRLPAVAAAVSELLDNVEFYDAGYCYIVDISTSPSPIVTTGWSPSRLTIHHDILRTLNCGEKTTLDIE